MARKHENEREWPVVGLQKIADETVPKETFPDQTVITDDPTKLGIKKPTQPLSDTFSWPEKLKKLTDD